MRTYLVGVPLLLLAAVLESTVIPDVRLGRGGLNLVLILSLGWTLAGDWQGGIGWGFIGGVFLGLLSGGPLGAASLALVLMTYFASLSEGRFYRSHILLPLAVGLLGTLGFHVMDIAILVIARPTVDWAAGVTQVILPALLINTVCMLPLSLGLRWLHAAVYPATVKA
jgi:rod shape-determining protein MreD